MKLYRQGSMDSLCGVYSILNAYKYYKNVKDYEVEILFQEIIEYFSKKKMLKTILLEGMGFKEVNMVMKDVVFGRYFDYKLSWASYPNPSTTVFWKSMVKFLQKENNCVIIGTNGIMNHWTTGVKCTSKTLTVLDGDMKYLKKDLCTTTIEDFERYYVMYPAQTYFIGDD